MQQRPHHSDPAPSTLDWDPVLVTLYTEHFDDMVRSARRLLDTTTLAEEAVQDSFVKYQTGRLRPAPGKELSYLRSIVLNTARSMLRHRRVTEAWRPEDPRTEPSTESEWLRSVDAQVVSIALAGLPSRQRDVLTIRHLVGCSERETATLLDISPGSVKTHASRARASMRTALAMAGAA